MTHSVTIVLMPMDVARRRDFTVPAGHGGHLKRECNQSTSSYLLDGTAGHKQALACGCRVGCGMWPFWQAGNGGERRAENQAMSAASFKKCPGFLEVGGIESFREPVVTLGQHGPGVGVAVLLPVQAGQTHGGP